MKFPLQFDKQLHSTLLTMNSFDFYLKYVFTTFILIYFILCTLRDLVSEVYEDLLCPQQLR